MEVFWQQIIIAAAVFLSVIYLGHHYFRRRRQKSGCSNCPTFRTLQSRQKAKPT